jgi:hypothetical protein
LIPVPSAQFLAVADFDRDGLLDLAVAGGGNVTFLKNTGAPDFLVGHGVPLILGSSITSIAAGDLDRDGDVDLVAADPVLGSVSIIWNAGCWNFPFVTRLKCENAEFVHLFDCSRDGILDIAVAQREADTVSIFWGALRTNLLPITNLTTGQPQDACGVCNTAFIDNVVYSLCRRFQLSAGSLPIGLASGDFDHDGHTDLVVANSGYDGLSGNVVPPVQVIYNPCCCRNCSQTIPCGEACGSAPGQCSEPEQPTGEGKKE